MTVVLKFNYFPKIAANLVPQCHTAVANTATIIVGKASGLAAVDTGFMASSGYVVTNDSSTYGSIGAPSKKGAYALPEEAAPGDPYTAIIGFAANYSVYQEFGTFKMSSHPFVVPAVLSSIPDFANELNKVFCI